MLKVFNFCTGSIYPDKYSNTLERDFVLKGYTIPLYASYRQIELSGGYVRRGEKGVIIGYDFNSNKPIVLFNINQCGWYFRTEKGCEGYNFSQLVACEYYKSI